MPPTFPRPKMPPGALLELSENNGGAPRQPSANRQRRQWQWRTASRAIRSWHAAPMPPAQRARKWRDHAACRPDVAPIRRHAGRPHRERPAEAPVPKPLVFGQFGQRHRQSRAEKRDAKIKALVRGFVRPVRVEPGRLDVNLTDGAPPTLLNDWRSSSRTGPASTGSSASAASRAADHGRGRSPRQEQQVSDARQDPDVAAILAQFPGAKIIDVRVKGAGAGRRGTSPGGPAAESEEGDILPGDDIEF
jgi:DNA polymerase-3 subunit gamma/tau